MLARAESHIVVKLYDFFARLLFILYPFGADNYLTAYVQGAEVLAPDFQPVVALYLLVGHFKRAEIYIAPAV